MKKSITKNYKQTQKLGEKLAQEILKNPNKNKATVLLLYGDLGGGKTTFLQGFAKGLGIKQKVLSPTFVIMKKFPLFSNTTIVTSGNSKTVFRNFYHIDAYRMKDYKDAKELGLKELFKNSENIIAIEWPERIQKMFTRQNARSAFVGLIKIKFKFINKNQREILINLKK